MRVHIHWIIESARVCNQLLKLIGEYFDRRWRIDEASRIQAGNLEDRQQIQNHLFRWRKLPLYKLLPVSALFESLSLIHI